MSSTVGGSLFLPEHSLEFGIGVPIQGFFSNLWLSFLDTLDDVFGFLSNAVPKACAAIPTMASSFCEKNLRVSSGLAGLLKSPEQKKFFWKVGPRVIMPQNLIM